MAAEHDEPPRLVGADLAQIDLLAHELAVVEPLRPGAGAGDTALLRGDGKAGPVLHARVAKSRRRGRGGLGNIEGELEPVPGGFGVRELDLPLDLRIALRPGELAHDSAERVHSIDSKPRRLALQ